MPSTAWTTPSSVPNSTTRSRIDRTGSGTNSPLLRIERVSEPVADEVDAEDDGDDREAWEHGQPPLLRIVLTRCDEHAERGRRRLDAEAEERERRFDEDRGGDRQRAVHDHGAERVREHVPEHDPQVTGAGRLRGLHVLLLAEREEDAANDPRERCPEEQREDE